MIVLWLIGCVLLSAALPGAILIPSRLGALAATLAVAGAWYLMWTFMPDIGMAGGLLLLGLLPLGAVGALAAVLIRIRSAMGSGYVR